MEFSTPLLREPLCTTTSFRHRSLGREILLRGLNLGSATTLSVFLGSDRNIFQGLVPGGTRISCRKPGASRGPGCRRRPGAR